MENWRFVCFVGHAMMRELEDIDKHKSYILFVAQHTSLEKNRLFINTTSPCRQIQRITPNEKVLQFFLK